jgi:hypothetical protein
VLVEGPYPVTHSAAAAPATPPDASGGAPWPSRKIASSLLFARGVAERHGGQVQQTVGDGVRRTRLVLPAGDVSDSSPT